MVPVNHGGHPSTYKKSTTVTGHWSTVLYHYVIPRQGPATIACYCIPGHVPTTSKSPDLGYGGFVPPGREQTLLVFGFFSSWPVCFVCVRAAGLPRRFIRWHRTCMDILWPTNLWWYTHWPLEALFIMTQYEYRCLLRFMTIKTSECRQFHLQQYIVALAYEYSWIFSGRSV